MNIFIYIMMTMIITMIMTIMMMMTMMGFKQTGPDRCCLPTHMCSRNFYLQLLLLLNCQHCIRKTYSCFAKTVLFLNFQLLLLLLLLIPTINIVTCTVFIYSDSICNCCITTVFVLYSCFAQTALYFYVQLLLLYCSHIIHTVFLFCPNCTLL